MISIRRGRSSWWMILALTVLVTGVAAGGLHRLSQSGKEPAAAEPQSTESAAADGALPAERAIALEGERIALRPVQRSVSAVGSFLGYDEVTVTAEVSGRVEQICHDVGDVVSPDDVLLELDKTDFDLELEQTRRALEMEVIRLGVEVPSEPLTPTEIAMRLATFDIKKLPSLIRAQKLEDIARLKSARAGELLQGKAMSEEDAEQRRSEYDVAEAALSQATYDAQAALAAIRHRTVLLRIAMRKRELSTIRVPTPTHRDQMPEKVQYAVVERKVTEGEMLKDAPGLSTATFELVMDGVLKLEAQVPERYTAEVQKGQDVQVRVDAYPDRVFAGKVLRISPAVDRASRTFSVQIYVENPQRELKAGGFANAEILTRVDPQAWTVSPECVLTYAGSTRLFVVRDGKAHTISVAKGVEGPGWVELIRADNADLRAEDIVVRGGQDKLAEGVPVQIRNLAGLRQTAEQPATTR